MQIVFRNLERSELAKNATVDRMENVFSTFPDLRECRVTVTLSMENSPVQPGPDLFGVKVHCKSGRYKGVTLTKTAPSLYAALADVVDHMLERLNRFGDRNRVKERKRARKLTASLSG